MSVSVDESLGRTWSVENKRAGKHTCATDGKATVSCVTACGNFGLVGSQAGDVELFNMQSGIKRKVFRVPNAGVNDVRGRHVTGVAVDALNRIVIVSTLKGALHVRRSPFAGPAARSPTDRRRSFTVLRLPDDEAPLNARAQGVRHLGPAPAR